MRPRVTALVALLALVFVACADDAVEPTTTAAEEPTTTAAEEPTTTAAEEPTTTAAEEAITLPPPEVTNIRIGISNLEANGFISKFAQDLDLYAKYGLETVEVLYFEGAAANTTALIADQIEVGSDSPETTLTALVTEDPLLDIAIYGLGFVDCIVAGPDIETAADLVGKRWAISSPGGQSHAITTLALEALGLTVEDVNITEIGGQGARVAALEAGSVDVIPADCPVAAQLVESAGMNILLDLTEIDIDFVTANLRVKRSFAEENPNTNLAVVAANLEAMQVLFSDTDKAVESYGAWAQVSPEDAAEAIEEFQRVAKRDLMPTLEGYEEVFSFQVLVNPDVVEVDVSEAFTTRFLDQLREMGLNDLLGVPST